jgi:pyridoxamine 5'-phosphate oxidase
MTLSTVDAAGRPSARTLVLKDLANDNWQFASGATSRKGKELANTPWAALTFYWPLPGRQVRMRGVVVVAGEEDSARDFLGRSTAARAARLQRVPDFVLPEWTVYDVRADEVGFWQGDEHRDHTRLRYTGTEEGWTRDLLWP